MQKSPSFGSKELDLVGNWSNICVEDMVVVPLLELPNSNLAILAILATFALLHPSFPEMKKYIQF